MITSFNPATEATLATLAQYEEYSSEQIEHRFRNMSDTEPMKIPWIYASVNATRTLVDSGETRPVAAEHAK